MNYGENMILLATYDNGSPYLSDININYRDYWYDAGYLGMRLYVKHPFNENHFIRITKEMNQ